MGVLRLIVWPAEYKMGQEEVRDKKIPDRKNNVIKDRSRARPVLKIEIGNRETGRG